MSHEETHPKLTALQSLLPIFMLLSMDYLGSVLVGNFALSRYSLGIIFAEVLLLLVFMKGQICNGQRSRLINANNYLAIFLGIWLAISALQGVISLFLFSVIGLAIIGIIYLRNYLRLAACLSLFSIMVYLYMVNQIDQASLRWLCYNPISQMLLGVFLANILLVISRNRLQGLIGLLPFVMAILLVLNVIYTLVILTCLPEGILVAKTVPFELPILVYFSLHIVMMGIIAFHILRNIKLDYFNLMLLFFIAASLPIWLGFLTI